MPPHFLFAPGTWLGTGQVSFSMSPDILHFRTQWIISQIGKNIFHSTQTVEIVGGDRIINMFEVTPRNAGSFDIVLENELLGTFSGTGVSENLLVAWEFREKGVFEGFEVYRRVDGTEYSLHAEYLSSEQSRTMIRGKIWKQTSRRQEEMAQNESDDDEFV